MLCAVLLLLAIPSLAHAQDGTTRERKNFVGGEILGRGVFLTVNYERYLTDIFSAGIGGFGFGSSDGAIFVMPLFAAATIGHPHSLYLSGGATFFAGSDFEAPGDNTETEWTPVFSAGYQWVATSGLYIRPMLNYLSEVGLVWPGFGIGGSF